MKRTQKELLGLIKTKNNNSCLLQAYRAYKRWVELHGEEPDLPGLNMTHDQLFFLNYAQGWDSMLL